MVYLLIVSLMLHFISFFFIVILFQRQNEQHPNDHKKTVKEMEDLLIAYTTEMKDNNDRLARRMNHLNIQHEGHPNVQNSVHTNLQPEEHTNTVEDQAQVSTANVDHKSSDSKSYANERVKEHEDFEDVKYSLYEPPSPQEETAHKYVETSTTSKVLSLYEKGYNVHDIAKQLDMGAGEVELLLKFNKQL
ncbi:DUF6115 domain-containing protein [Evansella halocellulosilytica]|uniref:DUF6115 domain-containing protein n=1 Tax=Evansella halocellulosilytica TaxID=2011013 RepID=UPI000BB86C17|nr:hypothetical protein [Evansella halocellulosilytica]